MYKNIGYHTRLDGNNSVKIIGGSFGGSLDVETANRLVKSHFTVKVKPSGRTVFVDNEGREVSLYITIDPDFTNAGIEAMNKYHIEKERLDQEREDQGQQESETIQSLMEGLTHDEIVKRLSGFKD